MITSRRLATPRRMAGCESVASFTLFSLYCETAGAESLVRNELVKVLPVGGGEREGFGASVAMDGDTAVIGADGTGFPIQVTGSAYVLTYDADGVWTQQAKCVAPDGPVNNLFGASVAISGDTFLVGAPFDNEVAESSGAVYVYQRNGEGIWSLDAKLIPSGAAYNTRVGLGVSLHGDTAATQCAGTVFVFRQNAQGTWLEEATLAASDGQWLGSAVGIEADIVVAGDVERGQFG